MIADLDTLLVALYVELTDRIIPARRPGRRARPGRPATVTDADHQVMDAYGAWGEKTRFGRASIGVLRSTFLVDEQGRIERAWHNVKADGHATQVLEALGPKV